jgi:tetraprenyl-beta-curcumene synthase
VGGVNDVDAHEPGTIGLVVTFARGALGYWACVFPRVCLHVTRWRRRARRIPDPVLRRVALEALSKRSDIEGATAFAAFAPLRRHADATLAAAAFQAAYSLLDMLGEQPSADPVADGRRLHEALVYAISPQEVLGAEGGKRGEPGLGRAQSGGPGLEGREPAGAGAGRLDWYEHHPQRDDGGYLDTLIEECRAALARLPSYAVAAPWVRAAAERIVGFQSLNLSEAQGEHHELERWAQQATPTDTDLRWWETAAAAGSSLAVHALIAAAAEPGLAPGEARALADAYFPWIGCLHSLLDNLIDKHEDEAAGHRSLLAYYDPQRAARRLALVAGRARAAASALPHAARHRVMLTAMVANYLSTPEARMPDLRPARTAVIAAAQPLVGAAMAVFAVRRLGR